MGDVLWLEPVLNELSKKNKKVFLYTNFYKLFNNYPNKNVVVKKIPYGLFRAYLKLLNLISIKKKYHRLDGYCYEAFPKMHILHAYQTYFSLPIENIYPKLFLSQKEKNDFLITSKNYVVFHLEPNAKLNFRKVYGINWEEIIVYLNSLKFDVIIVGTDVQEIVGAKIFKGNIRQLIQVIYNCKFFMGVDSGPSHIAASLQIPSIIFFGAVNPLYRHFDKIFKGEILQQPCEYAGCYHEVVGGAGQTCKLVGDSGIPKCSIHSNEILIEKINSVIKNYQINV